MFSRRILVTAAAVVLGITLGAESVDACNTVIRALKLVCVAEFREGWGLTSAEDVHMRQQHRNVGRFGACEALESRAMLSEVTVVGGLLSVSGEGATPNVITVLPQGADLKVTVNGRSKLVPADAVQRVRITGGEATDRILASAKLTIP